MTSVERFIEFLNLLNIGARIKIDSFVYGMDANDRIGTCTYDNQNNPTDQMIITDFSYHAFLELCSKKQFKEMHGMNMFDVISSFPDPNNIPTFCVTTNGDVKADGCAVMGKGVALQVKNQFNNIDSVLGGYIKQYGNRVFNLGIYTVYENNFSYKVRIVSFPTKHHWKEDSDINLIKTSCEELIQMCDKFGIQTCFLPAPGCSNGNLNYQVTVKPLLDLMLDERIYVCFN